MGSSPRKVCIKAWALNENTGERGELPAACNDFPLTTFGAPLAQEARVVLAAAERLGGEGLELDTVGPSVRCSIDQFKYGVADRGASIRIPRETEAKGKGYMEDMRPGANCDPYRVTARIVKTTLECMA